MIVRSISAFTALLFIIGAYYFFQTVGLYGVSIALIFIAITEYAALVFRKKNDPKIFRVLFIVCCLITFLSISFSESGVVRPLGNPLMGSAALAISAVLILSAFLLEVLRHKDPARALQSQGLSLMGLIYVGIFPAFAVKLLSLKQGDLLFAGLLLVVFSGDTFAYIVGKFFAGRSIKGRTLLGHHLLFSTVSPKKTVEGAFGGLIGSMVAGFIISSYISPNPGSGLFVIVALATGVFAQLGDLNESLLKRAADVKDSGSIMPGHGGVLDRLDGILFGAPVYYVLIHYLIS